MVNFGQAIGTACLAFLATNVDDAFVLVTFFAETASDPNSALTPWKIVIGQYVGFTVIFAISMIGFVVSLVMPTEPIGFLGLLPIMLGVWKLFDLLLPVAQAGDDPDGELAALRSTKARGYRAILKVALITLMNGGDNIGTYIPLFSQVNPPAVIAVYAVVFYIMLGLWCLVGWLLIRQRHVAKLAEKYVAKLIPFLYMGLGTFIIVESKAYPWSIEKIDTEVVTHPGTPILASMTVLTILVCIGLMAWLNKRQRDKANRVIAARAGSRGSEGAVAEIKLEAVTGDDTPERDLEVQELPSGAKELSVPDVTSKADMRAPAGPAQP